MDKETLANIQEKIKIARQRHTAALADINLMKSAGLTEQANAAMVTMQKLDAQIKQLEKVYSSAQAQ